jgi:hypothetical protein
MENELRDFFLTVANYPLPENAEKYIEAMKNIPETASHYYYVKWLRYGFERRQGRERIEGFFYPTNDPKVYSLFTDEDFKSFERNRALLISVLNQIFSGADFFWNERFSKISGYANSLQSREFFGISSTTAGTVLRKIKYDPKMDDAADELEEVFAFACYGLISFLADSRQGGRDRIKKCPICEKFFPAKDKKRKLCYENPSCFTESKRLQKQKQREVDPVKYL